MYVSGPDDVCCPPKKNKCQAIKCRAHMGGGKDGILFRRGVREKPTKKAWGLRPRVGLMACWWLVRGNLLFLMKSNMGVREVGGVVAWVEWGLGRVENKTDRLQIKVSFIPWGVPKKGKKGEGSTGGKQKGYRGWGDVERSLRAGPRQRLARSPLTASLGVLDTFHPP
jgi:hypothetical protein